MGKKNNFNKVHLKYFMVIAVSTVLIFFIFLSMIFFNFSYKTKKILEIYNSIVNIKTEINFLNSSLYKITSNPYRYIEKKNFYTSYKIIEKIKQEVNQLNENKLIKDNFYLNQLKTEINNLKTNLQKLENLNFLLFNPINSKLASIDHLINELKINNAYTSDPFRRYTQNIFETISKLKTNQLSYSSVIENLEFTKKNIRKLNLSPNQIQTKNSLLILTQKIIQSVNDYFFLLNEYGKDFSSGVLNEISTDKILNNTQSLSEIINDKIVEKKLINKIQLYSIHTLFLAFIIILMGFFMSLVVNKNLKLITKNLKELEIGDLSRKELIEKIYEFRNISLILNRISSNLKSKSKIIESFSKGKYNIHIQPLSNNDELGENLIKLKNYFKQYEKNIQQTKLSEEKQKWLTKGFAFFSDALRKYAINLDELLEKSFKTLLDYMQIPMGAIYYVNTEKKEKVYQLKIAYAYDKKKIKKLSYRLTEGFVGTVAADGNPIILEKVPENYLFYETAFGYGRPKSIAWFPVKDEKIIHAVIEIAFLKNFEEYDIQLIEKFCSDLATTINYVNINLKTKKLVQQLTEKTQEFEQREIEYKFHIEDLKDNIEILEKEIEELKIDLNIKQNIISEKISKIIELEKKNKEKELELRKTIERFQKIEELYKTKIENLEDQIQKLLDSGKEK